MIREYAVDPSALSQLGPMWMLMENMGVSKGRVIASFPKDWPELVRERCKASGCRDLETKMIFERLIRLERNAVIESGFRRYTVSRCWLDAAIACNAIEPFDAILTNDNAESNPCLLTPMAATNDNPQWIVRTSDPIPRTAEAIGDRIGSLGKIGKQLLFVDPYISCNPSVLKVLRTALTCCEVNRKYFSRIEFHVTEKFGP